jgi:hypothetical protein
VIAAVAAEEEAEGEAAGKKPAAGPKKAPGPAMPSLDDIGSSSDVPASATETLGQATPGAAEPKRAAPKPCDDDIKSESGKEAGRPFFLLKGRNAYVKGWVLHPADAEIKTGDPLQISTKGANAKIWLAMYVGAGEPVTAKIAGEGMDTKMDVAGRTIRFDGQRVLCE